LEAEFTPVRLEGTEELKENIRAEIENIPAEQLQKVNQDLFCRREYCLRVDVQHFRHLL
jgi:hypothetical protein